MTKPKTPKQPKPAKAWALDNDGCLNLPLVVRRTKASVTKWVRDHGYGCPQKVLITPIVPTRRKK